MDRAETYVLKKLKEKYPSAQNWPGIEERFRVYMSRSEWVCGVPLVEVEKLFKEVSASADFGDSLYILNGPDVNVPELWYKFRNGVITKAKETAAAKKAQQESDEAAQQRLRDKKRINEEIYGKRKYIKRVR